MRVTQSFVLPTAFAVVSISSTPQAEFFVPLADKHPEKAMSRFDSGQFPINAASKMAYVKAASSLGRMDQIDIQASRVPSQAYVALVARFAQRSRECPVPGSLGSTA